MHFLCPSAALAEGHSRAFSVDGVELFGVRRQGQVHLYRNRCPHRGIPCIGRRTPFSTTAPALSIARIMGLYF